MREEGRASCGNFLPWWNNMSDDLVWFWMPVYAATLMESLQESISGRHIDRNHLILTYKVESPNNWKSATINYFPCLYLDDCLWAVPLYLDIKLNVLRLFCYHGNFRWWGCSTTYCCEGFCAYSGMIVACNLWCVMQTKKKTMVKCSLICTCGQALFT